MPKKPAYLHVCARPCKKKTPRKQEFSMSIHNLFMFSPKYLNATFINIAFDAHILTDTGFHQGFLLIEQCSLMFL